MAKKYLDFSLNPFFSFFLFFFFLSLLVLLCSTQAWLPYGTWDLSSKTRDWTHFTYTERQILNHWTTKEVSKSVLNEQLVIFSLPLPKPMLTSVWAFSLLLWPISLNYEPRLLPICFRMVALPQSDIQRSLLPCRLGPPPFFPSPVKPQALLPLKPSPSISWWEPVDSCPLLKLNGLSLKSHPSCPSGVSPHSNSISYWIPISSLVFLRYCRVGYLILHPNHD